MPIYGGEEQLVRERTPAHHRPIASKLAIYNPRALWEGHVGNGRAGFIGGVAVAFLVAPRQDEPGF